MAQLEEILRPAEWEFPPYPAKSIVLASGETMVVRQAKREEVPLLLKAAAALTHVERDFYDIVAARTYAELLGWYRGASSRNGRLTRDVPVEDVLSPALHQLGESLKPLASQMTSATIHRPCSLRSRKLSSFMVRSRPTSERQQECETRASAITIRPLTLQP